jgi:two-component system cell cycle response regulator DivK
LTVDKNGGSVTHPIEPQEAHILIVEDNFSNFRLMARLLTYEGMKKCEWKTSGTQVVEFADALSRVDLILMDIYLPGEDGYQVLARLRAHPKLAETLIVAVTAEATLDNLAHARAAGFDGFIGKPINANRFPEQIRKILKGEPVWELK